MPSLLVAPSASLLSTLIAVVLASSLQADDQASALWFLKLDDAIQESKRTHHPILMDFSGSDWCDKCRVIKSEVFDSPAFAAWAQQNVVLLAVDIPISAHQPSDIKKQNDGLAKRFTVEEFPTLLVVDAELAGSTHIAYRTGGPVVFIAAAAQALNGK